MIAPGQAAHACGDGSPLADAIFPWVPGNVGEATHHHNGSPGAMRNGHPAGESMLDHDQLDDDSISVLMEIVTSKNSNNKQQSNKIVPADDS